MVQAAGRRRYSAALNACRPRQAGRFQPLLSNEITPAFLDRTIRALKRWKYDIVSIDEVCRRAVTLASPRRFVCLTFDGTYKDVAASAYPVLARHRVPFTVYVPTAFPDGIGEAWWLALEQVIARDRRISLMVGRSEMHFNVPTTSEKYELYDFLSGWMRSLEPADSDGRHQGPVHALRRRSCGIVTGGLAGLARP